MESSNQEFTPNPEAVKLFEPLGTRVKGSRSKNTSSETSSEDGRKGRVTLEELQRQLTSKKI